MSSVKSMDINRFTEKVQSALQAAQSFATREGHQQLDVEHLMMALLEQPEGLAPAILLKTGIALDRVAERIDAEIRKMPKVSSTSGAANQIYITGRLNTLIAKAEEEARKLKDDFVSVEHLLLAAIGEAGAT